MQKLKLLTLISAIALTSLFSQSGNPAAQEKNAKLPKLLDQCSVIDELDDCVQERFNSLDKGFGGARVITFMTNRHFGNFNPENEQEQEAIAQLKSDGWEVFLYLAGIEKLTASAAKPQHTDLMHGMQGLSGPATVIPMKMVGNQYHPNYELSWPQGPKRTFNRLLIPRVNNEALRTHAKQAFVTFAKADRYDFSIDGLSFTARPVRAQTSCLTCHGVNNPSNMEKGQQEKRNNKNDVLPLKVGDAIGATIYAYTNIKQK